MPVSVAGATLLSRLEIEQRDRVDVALRGRCVRRLEVDEARFDVDGEDLTRDLPLGQHAWL